MLKGVGKNVIVLKNTESDLFEEAIFILKTNDKVNKKDLIKECEKIINDNSRDKQSFSNSKSIKYFLVGLILLFLTFSILLIINLL